MEGDGEVMQLIQEHMTPESRSFDVEAAYKRVLSAGEQAIVKPVVFVSAGEQVNVKPGVLSTPEVVQPVVVPVINVDPQSFKELIDEMKAGAKKKLATSEVLLT